MYATRPPFSGYNDKSGNPLESGKLYFGVANQDPEAYPQAVYWDAAGTIPAAQPIRTLGGYPVYNGTPAVVYCNNFYSVTVRDKNDVFQYTFADSSAFDTPTSVAGSNVFSARNLLLNASFNINQRGYVSGAATGAANQYALDCWFIVASGQNATFSPDATTGGADNVVIAPAGGWQQIVEAGFIGGGTYTISWTGTALCAVNGTSVTKGQTVSLPANTNATVSFSGGTVARPQLELSPQKTQFDRRFLASDLLLCQRYFVVLRDVDNLGGIGSSAGASVSAHYAFPVPMRVTPTFAVLKSGSFNISDDYSSDPVAATATAFGSNLTPTGGRVFIGGFSGLVAGRWYAAPAGAGTSLFSLDARL